MCYCCNADMPPIDGVTKCRTFDNGKHRLVRRQEMAEDGTTDRVQWYMRAYDGTPDIPMARCPKCRRPLGNYVRPRRMAYTPPESRALGVMARIATHIHGIFNR